MKGGQVSSSMMRWASKLAASSGAVACEKSLSKEHIPSCEGNAKLQKRLSSVGRSPALQETRENPQSPMLLVALAGSPFAKKDLENFRRKGEIKSRVKEKSFPQIYNMDLQERLQSLLQTPTKNEEKLWNVEMSSGGTLGQSGAIPKERAAELIVHNSPNNKPTPTESLLLLRYQPALADGISLVEAFLDLCDEAHELKEEIEQEIENKERRLAWWQRLARLLHSLYFYSVGSLHALLYHCKLCWDQSGPSLDPFQQMEMLEDTTAKRRPGLSWLQVAPVKEVEEIAESLLYNRDEKGTVNDVIVSCVSAAVARQIQEHQMHWEIDDTKPNNLPIPPTVHAMVPLHDSRGGSYEEDQTLTRVPVPCDVTRPAAERLERVHDSLSHPRVPTTTPTLLGASTKTAPAAAFMIQSTPGPADRRILHVEGRPIPFILECQWVWWSPPMAASWACRSRPNLGQSPILKSFCVGSWRSTSCCTHKVQSP